MSQFPFDLTVAGTSPGEAFLAETPVLGGHAGTQPDLFLRWNAWPRGVQAVDVVLHLHGFSQQGGTMPLAEKIPRSGLDLAGRTRPTLAILPRGNWVAHEWYDFPGLLAGGIDRLIEYALQQFDPGGPLGLDRLILSAHSGGVMPAVDALTAMRRMPDELFLFDGLYGRQPELGGPLSGIEGIGAWLAGRIASEPSRPGALRIIYVEQQTGPYSREVGGLIARRLEAAPTGSRADLARRYRVERSGVPHGYIAEVCGPLLLADAASDVDWSRV